MTLLKTRTKGIRQKLVPKKRTAVAVADPKENSVPVKAVYMMTDLEGVAGVDDWDPRHRDDATTAKSVYDRAEMQRLLTGEVNAANFRPISRSKLQRIFQRQRIALQPPFQLQGERTAAAVAPHLEQFLAGGQ